MPDVDATHALVETWEIHDRINHYLLDGIPAGALAATAGGKGRTVAAQIGHLHNVRLMWLKVAAPQLLAGVEKLELDESLTAAALHAALTASGHAVTALLTGSAAAGGRIKGFKPHATAFLGYLISHESHHRGQIMLALRQSGHPVDRKVAFGIWEWGTR